MKTTEQTRLEEAREQKAPWKRWGPYLSERQWGTRYAKTTASPAMRGITSAMIKPALERIAGGKMV
jgi:hypothetical protein